jgi:hypothetical protein
MLQKMRAEILFLSPASVSPGTAVLVEHGFNVVVLDDVDPYGPTVFIRARITSEISPPKFLNWVQSLVDPFGGDVTEAGLDRQQGESP